MLTIPNPLSTKRDLEELIEEADQETPDTAKMTAIKNKIVAKKATTGLLAATAVIGLSVAAVKIVKSRLDETDETDE